MVPMGMITTFCLIKQHLKNEELKQIILHDLEQVHANEATYPTSMRLFH